jgi:hypothetical protein
LKPLQAEREASRAERAEGERRSGAALPRRAPGALELAILVAPGALAVAGWREFWLLTDDAFIAFRYAQNAVPARRAAHRRAHPSLRAVRPARPRPVDSGPIIRRRRP